MNVQRLKQSCQAQKNPDLKDGVILELIEMLEAAEAKLAELEKQEPGITVFKKADSVSVCMIGADLPDGYSDLFTRPAPAINLAELVPDNIPKDVYEVIYQECGGFVDCSANAQTIWKACRAAIMLKIEKRGADMLAAPEVE